jgi:hypothetical protein
VAVHNEKDTNNELCTLPTKLKPILPAASPPHSILIPKLHILAISKIRKLDIPRVLNNSSIPLPVLPAVIKQQRNRSRNGDRIHHDDRELRRKIQRRVTVAESQWAEDVALLMIKVSGQS